MNSDRRGFFKSLLGLGALAVSAQAIPVAAEPVKLVPFQPLGDNWCPPVTTTTWACSVPWHCTVVTANYNLHILDEVK